MTTDRMDRAWTGIEQHFPPAGVRLQMQALLGRRPLAALERADVVIRKGIADRFPCPSPGADGCPRQIHDNGNGTYIAFCGRNPPECDDVLLPEEDVRILSFDRAGFVAILRKRLQITGRPEWLAGLPNVCRLGSIVPDPVRVYPIFFASRCSPTDYAVCFDVLLAHTGGKPFAVLVPTRSHIAHDSQRRLAEVGAVLIVLADVMGVLTVNEQDHFAVIADVDPLFAHLGQAPARRTGKSRVVAHAILKQHGGGLSRLDLDQHDYERIVAETGKYDIFADAITRTCSKRNGKTRAVERDIVPAYFKTVREAMEGRVAYDPSTEGPDDCKAGKQTFQRARKTFDIGSRKQWRLFKTDMIDGAAMYRFDPDTDVSFVFIFAPSK